MNFLIKAVAFIGAVHALPSPAHPSTSGAPTVTIKNGTVVGLHNSHFNQDMFLGVPFAQPPVGELRFRQAQSINSTFKKTVQATQYAPECVGYGGDQIGYPVSEDCLYLNVIRPAGFEGQELPVGCWIHGGGLTEGGTRDRRYNLSFIVENSVNIGKPIIGVSIGYRLSAWGFLQSDEVSGSGNTNMGIRDQRLGLHWLQENIAAFGGAPDKVTIWGESAGALSVGVHLTAYNGRDDKLFRGAIMESGNPVNYNSYRDVGTTYQPLYDSVVEKTGCKKMTDTLDCLRHVPFQKLNSLFNTSTASTWQPIVDGDIIQRWGSIQLAEGNFVHVPIIDGANTDEGTAFGPKGVNTTQDFVNQATNPDGSTPLPSFLASQLLEAYPNTPKYWIPPVHEVGKITFPPEFGDEYRRSSGYFGDVVMIANRRGACETWSAAGVPAYSYRFNTIPAGISFETGVTHFQEVAFVFDNTNGLGYDAEHGTINPFQDKPESYSNLARLMSSSWASFIHDLNPNGFKTRHPEADSWPRYDVQNPQNIVWDANTTALGFAEPDTFRKDGIRFILDHALQYHR